MSVIITDMNMPKGCSDCKCTYNDWMGETRCCFGAKCIYWDHVPKDCPLKSADEMIKEIEDYANDQYSEGEYIAENTVLDIIHKYTDKEQT